ncbi:MAG: AAA family ATPase [Desulfobacterales bacterium]
MRIDALRLIAYGPFTAVELDLSKGREGCHLVYGLNEAGKSSALRALRHMLYGIPERSADNFIHPYAKMRIGATIRNHKGDAFEVIRRKGRGHTLRAADDTSVVEEAELQRLLSGVNVDLFATMFGMGYDDLVRGGRDIVQGGGDSGQLVFAAGSGIVNLTDIQNDLQLHADALFRPSGQKPKINAALGRLSRNRKELREAQLPGQEWLRHDTALTAALNKKKTVEEELIVLLRDLNRLRRIWEALPLIAERRELAGDLATYGNAVLLPEEFAEERQDLLVKIGIARTGRDRAVKNIAAHEQAIAALDIDSGLLDRAEPIEEIYRELGSQRKAVKDRLALETRRSTLLGEAREILGNLREDLTLEQAERLRIKKNEAVKIQELGTQYERIKTRIEDARDKLPALSREITDIKKDIGALDAPPVVEGLRAALAQAAEFGPLEKHNRAEQVDIISVRETIALEQSRLELGHHNTNDLEGLAAPSTDTVMAFEDRFEVLERRIDDLRGDIGQTRSRLQEVERQIEAHRLEREVPTEEDLQAAREKRDRGWQIILRRLNEAPVTEDELQAYVAATRGTKSLAEAFEADLQQADAVSDRLRREADRVATKARLLADQTAADGQLALLEEDLVSAEKEKNDLMAEWMAAWQPLGIVPRSPKEMGQWARRFRSLTEKVSEVRIRQTKSDALKEDIDAQRLNLVQGLRGSSGLAVAEDESLSGLSKRAQKWVQDADDVSLRRDQLLRDKARRERELEAAQSRLEQNEKERRVWQQKWEEAVRSIGLTAKALPAEANAVMDDLRGLFDKLKEAGILEKRIDGIDRDREAFVRKVDHLVAAVARDLAERPSDEAALELHTRLNWSRDARSKLETLQKQLAQERERLDLASDDILQVGTRLMNKCKQAGCSSADELPEAERRSNRRRQIESDLKKIDTRLHKLSAGATVVDFIEEALALDPDGIAGEIDRLTAVIEDRETAKSDLDQTIGGERTELSKMDGSARAAELAEEFQVILGGLDTDVTHYARLKIASRVLSLAIERFRDKSQGPLLKRASDLFSRITGGSFAGIRAEFAEDGRPVIVGVRPRGGGIVTVEGMSDGTADQLYLALRLAGLDAYLNNNEPLPLILDDILIMFDDDRAVATLKVLAELSHKTQVIFFTHHRHLAELAEKTIDASELILHTLER